MPTTIGNLQVNIILNNAQFITQINRTNQATQRAMTQMQKSVSGLDKAFLLLRRTFLGFFALSTINRAVRDVANYADAWKLASNQIAAANSIASLQARSMENLNALASETRTSLADTAELYARLLRSTEGLAKSEQEVADVTKTVSMAFKAGGASMQEAANGARQLGQSLASGIFQGDELRSIRENAPLLAQAIATEFNTTIGGLKALGAEGKLTADRVFKAILENAKPIRDAFAATNATIADSFTVLDNAISEYIGELDKATGTSVAFTKSILDLSKALREASKAPQGTNAFVNAQQDLNILWTAAKNKVSELNDEVERLTGVQSDFTQDTKDQIVTLAQWAHPVTHQLKLLELVRIAYEKLSGSVETFVSTQRMTGRGSALARPQPVPLPPMPKIPKDILELKDELRNQLRLQEAAAESAEAYEELKDQIEAENEVLKKFGSLAVQEGAGPMLELELATRKAAAATKELLDNQVKVFAASQGRTGLGAPGPGVVPAFPAGGGRTGIPEGRFPTKEALEFDRAIKLSSENWIRLRDAAHAGADALQLTKDVIEAENEALAAGHSRFTTRFNDAVAEIVFNKRIQRSVEELSQAYGETENIQRAIDQQKELQAALHVSAEAYNEAVLRQEALNYALGTNGGKVTDFVRGLAELKYQQLKVTESTDIMVDSMSKVPQLINSTVNSAIGSVASSFADAVVEGENFRDMLDSLLKDLAKLALNAVFQYFLKQLIGGVAVPGGAPGSGLLGMVPLPATAMHSGGIAGSGGQRMSSFPAALFANSHRFHAGLLPGEFPAILQKGEGVFTDRQMKALSGGGNVNINIQNRNGSDVKADANRDDNGNMNIEVIIDQVVGRKLLQPGASSNRAMKQGFGAQPVGIRR